MGQPEEITGKKEGEEVTLYVSPVVMEKPPSRLAQYVKALRGGFFQGLFFGRKHPQNPLPTAEVFASQESAPVVASAPLHATIGSDDRRRRERRNVAAGAAVVAGATVLAIGTVLYRPDDENGVSPGRPADEGKPTAKLEFPEKEIAEIRGYRPESELETLEERMPAPIIGETKQPDISLTVEVPEIDPPNEVIAEPEPEEPPFIIEVPHTIEPEPAMDPVDIPESSVSFPLGTDVPLSPGDGEFLPPEAESPASPIRIGTPVTYTVRDGMVHFNPPALDMENAQISYHTQGITTTIPLDGGASVSLDDLQDAQHVWVQFTCQRVVLLNEQISFPGGIQVQARPDLVDFINTSTRKTWIDVNMRDLDGFDLASQGVPVPLRPGVSFFYHCHDNTAWPLTINIMQRQELEF